MATTSSKSVDRTTKKLPWGTKDGQEIADEAAKIARTEMQKRQWSSRAVSSVKPKVGKGWVGLETSLKYVMHQNRGTEPYLMHWVEGRTIPMGNGEFRRGKDVGKPGWVELPGGVKKWRDQKWRHPGLKGNKIFERALAEAMRKYKPKLRKRLINVLMGEYEDGR